MPVAAAGKESDAGAEARDKAERGLEGSELSKREFDQRLRRIERGAERDEFLTSKAQPLRPRIPNGIDPSSRTTALEVL
jgi:hypothetical protein